LDIRELCRFELCRFDRARQLMGYTGVGPSEHSSGERVRRYGIAKTGNAHLRRVVIEASWAYRHRPWRGGLLKQRQRGLSTQVTEIAWKAQHRLHDRHCKLLAGVRASSTRSWRSHASCSALSGQSVAKLNGRYSRNLAP
jgi:Transposase IS116/IS110/IS902 family